MKEKVIVVFLGKECEMEKTHAELFVRYNKDARIKENNLIYTVYAEKDDITFIMKESDHNIEVVGFYFGEPDEEATKEYQGKLKADF